MGSLIPISSSRVKALTHASFLNQANYPPADGRREKLLAHFNVPDFVANRTCSVLNGYFGSKTEYAVEGTTKHVASASKRSILSTNARRNYKFGIGS